MSLVRVRPKNQITLPREVVDFLHISVPTHIEYHIRKDGVLFTAASQPTSENKLSKLHRLSKPDRGVFKSAAEVDAYINELRE
ncbi:MAG: hypothetical protein RLZZ502_304 [Pseudomonadota bacterium]